MFEAPWRVSGRGLAALLALVLATAMTLGSALPAHAASRTVEDKKGDAPATIDLVRATYTNGHTFVAFRWKFAELNNATIAHGTLETCSGTCSDYYRVAVSRPGGNLRVKLLQGNTKVQACKGMQLGLRASEALVTARVPKNCLVSPASLFMQAVATRGAWHDPNAYDSAPGRHVARG